MLFAPFIARVYGPEAYGHLGTFLAFVAIVSPLSALTYPIAIVLPKRDDDALGMAMLSFYTSLFFFCLVVLLLLFFKALVVELLNIKSFEPYLIYVPFAMLFSSWVQIGQQWLIRKKGFIYISKSAISYSLIENVSKACVGLFAPFVGILIGLTTLGSLIHAFFLAIFSRRFWGSSKFSNQIVPPVCRLAYRYRDFPLYRMPQNLINAASASLPILMIAAFFGPGAAGFYSLAKMVMGVPSALIGKAVSDVFYPYITQSVYRKKNIARTIIKGTAGLFFLGIIPFGSVIIFGPELFELVFGEDWRKAGEYSRWLAGFFLFNFINKPCVAAVPALGLQKGLLIYEVFSTGGKAVALYFGFYGFDNDVVAVAFFSVSGVIAYTLMMVWIFLKSRAWDECYETSR